MKKKKPVTRAGYLSKKPAGLASLSQANEEGNHETNEVQVLNPLAVAVMSDRWDQRRPLNSNVQLLILGAGESKTESEIAQLTQMDALFPGASKWSNKQIEDNYLII
jgi:hypothetical protein